MTIKTIKDNSLRIGNLTHKPKDPRDNLSFKAGIVPTLFHQMYIVQGRYQDVIILIFVHFFMLCKDKIDFGEV